MKKCKQCKRKECFEAQKNLYKENLRGDASHLWVKLCLGYFSILNNERIQKRR